MPAYEEDFTELMGQDWIGIGNAALSHCDKDARAIIFAWALADDDPRPPAAAPCDCSQD